MNLYQRICRLCESKGISPNKMSIDLGMSRSSIPQLKSGHITTLKPATLAKIADYFDVTVDYLLGTERAMPENIRPLLKKKLPVLGHIACGEPIYNEEQFDAYIPVDGGIDADFSVQCVGDSMIGVGINDGDYVLVKSSPVCPNGKIAAVQIGDEATLKKYEYYPEEGLLILSPYNSNHRTQIYRGADLDTVHCLGIATAVVRRL